MNTLVKNKLFLLTAVCLFACGSMWAQSIEEVKIKGSFDNTPLDLALLHLEIGYQIEFQYEEADLEGLRISTSFGRKPLSDAMPFLLNGTGLDFSLLGPKTVSIFPQAEEEEKAPPASEATAFNVTVSGVIKDKKTGETLPYASALVSGTGKGTTSNVDGYFSLFEVPNDTSLIEFRYLGYQPLSYRLQPGMDMQALTIYLEDFNVQLDEVLLLAEKEEQLLAASSGISKIKVSPAQLAKLPSFGEKDIFRSLQLLPGISGTNESSSGLYVRGGTPDQNLILFDGFTVYHVDHLFGFFSAFNPNAVKDVQLYKGGFDARFGGRLSSVVELTGKDGNSEQFNMGFGASLLSVNGHVETPFAGGKGAILLAARRSFQSSFYNNLYQSFTENDPTATEAGGPGGGGFGGRFGQQAEPSSHFYDLNAKVTFRPNPRDIFSVSFFNGEDDLDNSRDLNSNALGGRFGGGAQANVNFISTNTDLTQWGNWGSSAKWSRKWTDRFYSNAHLSYSNYYSERDRRNQTTIEREDTTTTRGGGTYEYNDLKDYTFKLENELKLGDNNQLEFGMESAYYDIQYEYVQNDTIQVLNRDDQGISASLYVQDQHVFFNKLMLKGGLRTTYFQPTDQVYYEPRASLSFQASNQIKLKAAWGQYYQFATRIVREDIQQGSRDFWVLANGDNIPVGYSEHFIAGASFETPSFLVDVEAYYKNLDGLSEYTTRFAASGFGPNRSLDYEELFYAGTGVARGIEVLLQKKVGKFTGWIGYTIGEVLYDFDAFGEEPFYANQDQRHELKLVGTYAWKNWDFAATFVYATGKPYTAPTGFYEVPLLDGTTAAFFELSGKNALRLPDYHRADLSATYNFQLGTSKASAGLSLFNLYNRQNIWYKEYEVIEGQLIETDVSLLNFTPSLFFTWTLR